MNNTSVISSVSLNGTAKAVDLVALAGECEVKRPGSEQDSSSGDNESGHGKPKQADLLFQLVHDRALLFTAQDGERFARVPVDEHYECY